ncbi:hypothetical protein C4572_01340 [Candidatus Parcubacteria bacterium]|nr:MAG: hypothetical protein C4572_01340 [Candidatus Parcubacteria bacterium]
MENDKIEKIVNIIKSYPEIKLAYFFGSKARGDSGPLSDYDFAFYLDERDTGKIFKVKFSLQDKISRELKTDKLDIVILDLIKSPEVKYNIIKEGRLIYELEPYKILVEPKILNEYFDFRTILSKYNLTKA